MFNFNEVRMLKLWVLALLFWTLMIWGFAFSTYLQLRHYQQGQYSLMQAQIDFDKYVHTKLESINCGTVCCYHQPPICKDKP